MSRSGVGGSGMNSRQVVVLFLASLSVSLIFLMAFFSLFFKNLDIEFGARVPESAPQAEMAPNSTPEHYKADGLTHAQLQLPPEDGLPVVGTSPVAASTAPTETITPAVEPVDDAPAPAGFEDAPPDDPPEPAMAPSEHEPSSVVTPAPARPVVRHRQRPPVINQPPPPPEPPVPAIEDDPNAQ
jgi:hypothetical protein